MQNRSRRVNSAVQPQHQEFLHQVGRHNVTCMSSIILPSARYHTCKTPVCLPSVHLSVCLLSVYLHVCKTPFCLSVCLTACLSVKRLTVYLSVYLTVYYQSTCLSVCKPPQLLVCSFCKSDEKQQFYFK